MHVIKYRPDIDGLRAVAVLLVLLFHFFPNFLTGGFVGVDVFFVISGYLITSIIVTDFQNGRFSLRNFYAKRVRRIFPALTIVLFTVFIFSWAFLTEGEFRFISKHIWAGSFFVSNIVLWKEAGYFDPAAEMKPLLNLWSLGVEEQFYFFWPCLLLVILKWPKYVFRICASLFVLSFLYCLAKTQQNSIASFYSPISRFWELYLGCGLAFFKTKFFPKADIKFVSRVQMAQVETVGAWLGMLGILLTAISVDKQTPFPGWVALFPTIGTLLIINNGQDSLFSRILSSGPFRSIGLISYPLYLWHWPLLVLFRIVKFREPTNSEKFLLIAVCMILSAATYKLIERPLRHKRIKPVVLGLVPAMMLVGILGVMGHSSFFPLSEYAAGAKKFEFGLTENRSDLTDIYKKLWREECNFGNLEKIGADIDVTCTGSVAMKKVFLWGDSHAQHLNAGLVKYLAEYDVAVLQVASSGCPPALSDGDGTMCLRSNAYAMKMIDELRPDVVILAQQGGHEVSKFDEIIAWLNSMKIKCILVGPVPQWNSDLYKILYRKYVSKGETIPNRLRGYLTSKCLSTDRILQNEYAQSKSVNYISLIDKLCGEDGCIVRVGERMPDDLITFDYGHLSQQGSEFVASLVVGPAVVGALDVMITDRGDR